MNDHEDRDADAGWDADPELRDRLRAVDPAASLPPADPTRVVRLLEDTMSHPVDTEVATPTRATGTRGRGPLTWLVAAAAIVLIAGVGLFGLLDHDSGNKVPAAGAPTVTELAAPGHEAYSGRCMLPNAATLSQQTLAFDATVTDVTDGVVTLAPTHYYAGHPTDAVKVRATSAEMRDLVQAVAFKDGGRYLVSATDGQVSVCGFSAKWSPRLASLYEQAFPAQH